MALVKKMGIPIKDNGHSVTNFSDIDLDSYCLPRILDAKMMGSITNVRGAKIHKIHTKITILYFILGGIMQSVLVSTRA